MEPFNETPEPLVDVIVHFFEEVEKQKFESYRQRAVLHLFLDLLLDGMPLKGQET